MSGWVRSLERAFRHVVVYPVLRAILRNEQTPLPVDLNRMQRVLLLRYDRLGDVVVTSPMVRRLRDLAPHLSIGMMASTGNIVAAKLLQGIDHYHVLGGSFSGSWNAIRNARSLRYDLVVNLVFNRTTSGGLLANLIAPQGIKVGQGAEKYRFYFNALARLDRGQEHMSEVLRSLGRQVFGDHFVDDDLRYTLTDDVEAVKRVDQFMSQLDSKPALLNISAGDVLRTPSMEQIVEIVRHVRTHYGLPVVLVAAPGKEEWRRSVVVACADPLVRSYPTSGIASFADMVAIVRRSRFLITPDTSLVHVAGATSTPVLGLYTTAFTVTEWGPRHTISEVVLGEEGHPLSDMSVPRILEGLDRLVAKVSR